MLGYLQRDIVINFQFQIQIKFLFSFICNKLWFKLHSYTIIDIIKSILRCLIFILEFGY